MLPAVVQAPPPVSVTTQNPTFTYPRATLVGNLLILFFSWANTSGSVSGVSDSLNGAWTQLDFQQPASSLRTQYVFAKVVTTAGVPTVTISTDASRSYSFSFYEASGALITLDGAAVHTFSTTSVTSGTSGTLTTTKANSLVFFFGKGGASPTLPGAPWNGESSGSHVTAYQVGPAGSYSASWTFGSATYASTVIAFQAGVAPIQSTILAANGTNPYTLAYGGPVKAGSFLIAVFCWATGTGTVTAFGDNLNGANSWTQASFSQNQGGGGRSVGIWFINNTQGGALTVSVTLSAAQSSLFFALYEFPGTATIALDSAGNGGNSTATTAPTTPALNPAQANDLVVAAVRGGTVSASTTGWTAQSTGGFGAEFVNPGSTAAISASWTTVSSAYGSTIAAFIVTAVLRPGPSGQVAPLASVNVRLLIRALPSAQVAPLASVNIRLKPITPPGAGTPTFVGDTTFSLMAKSNQALGGAGTTPADNELTLLAKQLRLLGAAGAQANTNCFILLARINKQLGGSGTTPSDNVFTLLAKQNRLLGGAGAVAGDTVFTLLAKNTKLFHH